MNVKHRVKTYKNNSLIKINLVNSHSNYTIMTWEVDRVLINKLIGLNKKKTPSLNDQ